MISDLFWNIYEFLTEQKQNDILDDLCEDNDFAFNLFINEIKCKSDDDLIELINDILLQLKNKQSIG